MVFYRPATAIRSPTVLGGDELMYATLNTKPIHITEYVVNALIIRF